jgi:hypothetical protein
MTTFNRFRPVSDVVPGLTKDIFGKKNQLFGKMLADWAQIAGNDIASKTIPIDLKFSREKNKKDSHQAILSLAIQGGYALEFTYQKSLLIERLNTFFGYPAIKDIKIVQNSEIMNKKEIAPFRMLPVDMQDEKKIDTLVSTIEENDLQTALKNLGKAILSRQDKAS